MKDENYNVKKGVYDTIVKFQGQYNIPKDVIPHVDISDALSSRNMKSPVSIKKLVNSVVDVLTPQNIHVFLNMIYFFLMSRKI